MVQQNCQEENTNSENPLKGGNRPQGVRISAENFKVKRESLKRQSQQMTLKPWSMQGDFIYRYHNEPRVQRAEGRNIPYSTETH